MDPWGVFWNPPGSEHDKSATATEKNNAKMTPLQLRVVEQKLI